MKLNRIKSVILGTIVLISCISLILSTKVEETTSLENSLETSLEKIKVSLNNINNTKSLHFQKEVFKVTINTFSEEQSASDGSISHENSEVTLDEENMKMKVDGVNKTIKYEE